MEKKLYRSKTDKKLAGVCGGIAKFFGIDPTIIRLIWALAAVFAAGLVVYIVCALVIPEEPEDYVEVK
ncbi:MAG: PspC domain-containing protein [Oscillospiraceae bacterium]|nr:PspC domain-containing protein [Oscillospiraceae bacterium]